MIKNGLALIGLTVIGFFGAGWYLDWYKVGHQATTDGERRLQFDVNTRKVVGDTRDVLKKGGKILDELREQPPEASQVPEPGRPTPPPPAVTGEWYAPPPQFAGPPQAPERPRRVIRRVRGEEGS